MSDADKSSEANETFFAEGLAKLRAGEMEESTGKLLMDLMEIRSDKVLLPFARKWIKLFPRVESAPRLVGKWLQNYESNDAMYLATSYVKTYPDVNALILIVRAVAQLSKIPPKLLDALEKRFAAEPNSHVWSRLQASENPKEELNVLILRWLEINRYDPKHAVEVSWVALFSHANEVLNEILRWIEVNQDKTPDVWLVFMNMLRGNYDAHNDLRSRVAVTASQYLKKHPDERNAGRLAYEILLALPTVEHIQSTKAWFFTHRESEGAHMALAGIFSASHLLGEPIESEFVLHAKSALKDRKPEERSPVLAIELYKESKDSDSLSLAKETWRHRESLTWFHAALLRVAPDEELISKANEFCAKANNGSPEIVIELLKLDGQNVDAKKAARKWIDQNPNHEKAKELQTLLKD